LPTSSESYRAWATGSQQACSRRLKRARDTSGGGSSFWPTPTASDAGYVPDLVVDQGALRFIGPADIPDHSGGQFSLDNAARGWMTLWSILTAMGWSPGLMMMGASSRLSSPPVRVTFGHGKGSWLRGLISNPRFYELTMGWPIGWTDVERPVTEWSRWRQRSRGALSALLSTFEAEPEDAQG
jgi:hypothetical protein